MKSFSERLKLGSKFSALFALQLCLAAGLLSCTQSDHFIPQGISGSVAIVPGTESDSDINNPDTTPTSNNSLNNVQSIGNPVQLGGFVQASSDPHDYFYVHLAQNQLIRLSTDPGPATVTLRLLNIAGSAVASDSNATYLSTLSVTAPASGDYYIHVLANSGSHNYVLSVGTATTAPVAVSGTSLAQTTTAGTTIAQTTRAHTEFALGEIIIEPATPSNGGSTSTLPAGVKPMGSLAQRFNLPLKTGLERGQLLRLGDKISRERIMAALGVQPNSSANAQEQLKQDTIAVLEKLQQQPGIRARLNYVRKALLTPNDVNYRQQWHYTMMNLPRAWDISAPQGQNTIVAVLDTRVLPHEDFNGQLLPEADFVNDGIYTTSESHGTHVAGTIAARTNNSIGVAGVAGLNARIMPVRVLDDNGYGYDHDIEQGIRYAAGLDNDLESTAETATRVANGEVADVINLSLGGPEGSGPTPAAYVQARAAGVIIVAAAGNERSNHPSYPAAYPEVVAVSAVDAKKISAFYSNFGSYISVAAPGGDIDADLNKDLNRDGIFSTLYNDFGDATYGLMSGTSMASPHVAGVAALMKSVYKNLSPEQFDTALSSGRIIEDLGLPGKDALYGYGLIDACKAVIYAAELAQTTVPVINSTLSVAPGILNFALSSDHADFQVSRGCGTTAVSVTEPSSDTPWISLRPLNVDTNGLGTYRATIDRAMLSQDPVRNTSGNIKINGSDLPALVQKQAQQTQINPQYLILYTYDSSLNRVVETDRRVFTHAAASFEFQFSNIPPGYYHLAYTSNFGGGNPVAISYFPDGYAIYCYYGEACDIRDVIMQPDGRIGGIHFLGGFDRISIN
ncbi:MAG: S8 family serine peptidase [Gammaproteobacteria bacterium]|nr:S8 family serine peptidase [Gammaproteobacteria bacterium]MDH5800306.1 S8 family serine peptidase [Gammaproteobacteria bacterium]